MKRLLAKLPRSSSGSRDASASSSASRLPFDILEVSMIDDGAGFSGLALVSSETCLSGASSDDFMIRKISFRRVRVSSEFHTVRIFHPPSRAGPSHRQSSSNQNGQQSVMVRRDVAQTQSRE